MSRVKNRLNELREQGLAGLARVAPPAIRWGSTQLGRVLPYVAGGAAVAAGLENIKKTAQERNKLIDRFARGSRSTPKNPKMVRTLPDSYSGNPFAGSSRALPKAQDLPGTETVAKATPKVAALPTTATATKVATAQPTSAPKPKKPKSRRTRTRRVRGEGDGDEENRKKDDKEETLSAETPAKSTVYSRVAQVLRRR